MLKNSKSFSFIILASLSSSLIPLKYQANASEPSITLKYGYPKSFESCIEQAFSGKTLAEVENNCARQSFEEKQKELDSKVNQIILLYEKNDRTPDLKKFRALQTKFMSFLKDYGKLHASPFLRTYPYHYYGSMIDLINVRISHLDIIANELE